MQKHNEQKFSRYSKDILAISSSVLQNNFNSSTKLFSDLYLAKFLDKIIQENRSFRVKISQNYPFNKPLSTSVIALR